MSSLATEKTTLEEGSDPSSSSTAGAQRFLAPCPPLVGFRGSDRNDLDLSREVQSPHLAPFSELDGVDGSEAFKHSSATHSDVSIVELSAAFCRRDSPVEECLFLLFAIIIRSLHRFISPERCADALGSTIEEHFGHLRGSFGKCLADRRAVLDRRGTYDEQLMHFDGLCDGRLGFWGFDFSFLMEKKSLSDVGSCSCSRVFETFFSGILARMALEKKLLSSPPCPSLLPSLDRGETTGIL